MASSSCRAEDIIQKMILHGLHQQTALESGIEIIVRGTDGYFGRVIDYEEFARIAAATRQSRNYRLRGEAEQSRDDFLYQRTGILARADGAQFLVGYAMEKKNSERSWIGQINPPVQISWADRFDLPPGFGYRLWVGFAKSQAQVIIDPRDRIEFDEAAAYCDEIARDF